MAVSRRRRSPGKAVELERRNQLARAVFNAWPCEGLEFANFWDQTTGRPKDGGGDTLLLFVLREMKDTVDFKCSAHDAISLTRGIVTQAWSDLDVLDDNLVEYLDNDDKRRRRLW